MHPCVLRKGFAFILMRACLFIGLVFIFFLRR